MIASMNTTCKKQDGSEDGTSDASTAAPFNPPKSIFNLGSLYSNNTKEETQYLADAKVLHQENPTMTFAECLRFRRLRTMNKARRKLNLYRKWQKQYNMDDIPIKIQTVSFVSDSQFWDYAVSHSLQFFPGLNLKKCKLPRIARIIGDRPNQCLDNYAENPTNSICRKRILYVLPMLIDPKIAPLELYSLVFATYFYLNLDRRGMEDVVTILDARYGRGWPNLSPLSILPFAKQTAKHMDWFPQRLDKFYAYPVPYPAQLGWSIIKQFLNPATVDKVHIHWGSSSVDACPPTCFAEEYFAESTMDRLENERRSEFL